MSRLERLKDAIEGECDGLGITDEQAKAILEYVDEGTVLAVVATANLTMLGALKECIETLALVEYPSHTDPVHGEVVRDLGSRIGYGALMSSASASWRAALENRGGPVGGEFVAGPCQAMVDRALKQAREAVGTAGSL
ncbi:hypothetical protein NKJ09_23410 [Mesorhizobium sp. M0189]|uniref:hypothetical protein n=1 Tax=Mesorhizobium sp. M0189 TaxID=2956909 RepID=UPI003339AE39